MAKEPEDHNTDLETLFERNHRKVVYFFLHAGVPRDGALDLAQETFLRAHRGWAGYRGEASEATWLFEIARNLFKNWLRDRQTLKKSGIEISLDSPTGDEEGRNELDLPDADPLALDRLLQSEQQAQLLAAIEKLSTQRRQCVKARLRGWKYSEIATYMKLSIETVKSHLHQARAELQHQLGTEARMRAGQ